MKMKKPAMKFEVIYMKADYEPWWMFEDWESLIKKNSCFDEVEDANRYFRQLKNELSEKHEYAAQKHDCFFAFWSDNEQYYCEGCDEDQQLYHGIILMKDGKPSPFNEE